MPPSKKPSASVNPGIKALAKKATDIAVRILPLQSKAGNDTPPSPQLFP
jgi:hypothetical protein